MKRLVLGAALAAFFVGSAGAQEAFNPLLTAIPVTPNLAVTASATANFPIPGGPARFIALKNDCSRTLYFDLRGAPIGAPSNAYWIRLASSETFSGPFQVRSVAVSPASGGTTACTFTMAPGR